MKKALNTIFKPLVWLLANALTILPLGRCVYIYMYIHTHTHTHIHIYHHHHIALVARISLTLSRHSSLSFIALGRSSGQHPVSSHSCWMYVRAGRPAFARPCVGIHNSTSLMSSSLLLQQCPACLARLTWIVIGGRWPYSWCLVGCCCQDLFRIARSSESLTLYLHPSRLFIALGRSSRRHWASAQNSYFSSWLNLVSPCVGISCLFYLEWFVR